jgi:diaminopimelate decarboxylase
VHEGDIVALPNVGSYNASMSSAHCLRGPAASIAFPARA